MAQVRVSADRFPTVQQSQAARDSFREWLSSWSCSSIGFPERRDVVSVVSCLEAYAGARDAAPLADSAAARAGQHVMPAAIVPAHQIGLLKSPFFGTYGAP